MFQGVPLAPLIILDDSLHIPRRSLENELLLNRQARGNELSLSILDDRDWRFGRFEEILVATVRLK